MFKIGASISLDLIHSEKQESYRCKIVEENKGTVYIDYPINQETGRTVYLIDGTQLKVKMVIDNVPYIFDTEVLGRVKKNIPMIILRYPGDSQLMKIQRREYVRVDASIDVSVTVNDTARFSTLTEDISAGGCVLIIPNDIEMKEKNFVKLLLVLPMQTGEYHYLTIDGKTVRFLDKGNRQLVSVQFLNLNETSKQIIMRYCFERQLILRKKGLLE
ncbi:flagellar brake domain-containing protein [Bacillus spongiae]|uniref:Flagellar brake domain-containing protein n=1 Tax=Bacillus spongiae TaxID=2683610 RepID=A0ABU8HD92_9BACI